MVTQLVQCKICRRILDDYVFTDGLIIHIWEHHTDLNKIPAKYDVLNYFNIYGGEGSDFKVEKIDLEIQR